MSVVVNTPAAWSERAVQAASWHAGLQSEHGQVQRFLAVLRHLDLRDGDTLLDFGCGTGRLCEFLPRGVTYYAHDWAEGMLDRVQREHARAQVLTLADLTMPALRSFDHVVAIGPFNLADGWSRSETWETLAELWLSHTERTLIVSLYRGDDTRNLYYAPDDLSAFARRMNCRRFAIDASYLDNDLLLVMRR